MRQLPREHQRLGGLREQGGQLFSPKAEPISHRDQRQLPFELGPPHLERMPPSCSGGGQCVPQQPGLTDAGFAVEHNDARPLTRGLADEPLDEDHLCIPPEERGWGVHHDRHCCVLGRSVSWLDLGGDEFAPQGQSESSMTTTRRR